MLIDAGVWLYELPKCGYYPWRVRRGAGPSFGGIAQTFAALSRWADGKLLGQTATFEARDGDELAEAYLLDIHQGAHGDVLIGIWNRLQGNRHHVASVGIGDVVGAATAEITEIDRNRIPGYATYFWIMPAERRVATIRLKHLSHGMVNFTKYISSFLKYINPDHVVLGAPDDDEIVVVGYRPDHAQPRADGIRPLFTVKSIGLGGDIAYLRANVGAINKVLCKTVLQVAEPQDYRWWQTMLDLSRIGRRPPPAIEEAAIRVEFPMNFTLDELNRTIAEWEDDLNQIGDRENDIGFKTNTGVIKWLSRAQARTEVPIDVQWVDDELVNMEALLGQLQAHRAAVLSLG